MYQILAFASIAWNELVPLEPFHEAGNRGWCMAPGHQGTVEVEGPQCGVLPTWFLLLMNDQVVHSSSVAGSFGCMELPLQGNQRMGSNSLLIVTAPTSVVVAHLVHQLDGATDGPDTGAAFFWMRVWQCFWMGWTFELVNSVKQTTLPNVRGPRTIH